MIFCDIDGTLINENYQISPLTVKALQDLINQDRSFHFALISGRSCAHELIFYKELGLKPTGLLVGSNGAQIYNLSSHKMIKE
ncbi:HAD hydrolase family protein [bacterium]|nr:HAD hydrolase family protein [bacterium]MBP5783097.1 HAD hydrolase family protein [bacterium]